MKERKSLAILLASALTIACFLAVAGCGSSPQASTASSDSASASTQASSSSSASASTQASASEAESASQSQSVTEESAKKLLQDAGITDQSIAEESVKGYWMITDVEESDSELEGKLAENGITSMEDLADKGLASILHFDGKGGCTYTTHIGEYELKRIGTYELRDGKLYFSVSEAKYGKITANGIQNAEVTIEGDTLTSNDMNDAKSTTTAKKLSKKEYKALMKKVRAALGKKLKVGDEASTDFYKLHIDAFEYMDEVYPSDTSGYYTYFQHQDGYTYLVVQATYTNLGNEFAGPCQATAAQFNVGDNKYSAEVDIDWSDKLTTIYTVDPMETKTIYVVTAIPDAAKDSGEASLTWYWPKDADTMQNYYSSSDSHDRYSVIM